MNKKTTSLLVLMALSPALLIQHDTLAQTVVLERPKAKDKVKAKTKVESPKHVEVEEDDTLNDDLDSLLVENEDEVTEKAKALKDKIAEFGVIQKKSGKAAEVFFLNEKASRIFREQVLVRYQEFSKLVKEKFAIENSNKKIPELLGAESVKTMIDLKKGFDKSKTPAMQKANSLVSELNKLQKEADEETAAETAEVEVDTVKTKVIAKTATADTVQCHALDIPEFMLTPFVQIPDAYNTYFREKLGLKNGISFKYKTVNKNSDGSLTFNDPYFEFNEEELPWDAATTDLNSLARQYGLTTCVRIEKEKYFFAKDGYSIDDEMNYHFIKKGVHKAIKSITCKNERSEEFEKQLVAEKAKKEFSKLMERFKTLTEITPILIRQDNVDNFKLVINRAKEHGATTEFLAKELQIIFHTIAKDSTVRGDNDLPATKIAQMLLNEYQTKINGSDDSDAGNTPLIQAVKSKNVPIVKLLVTNLADVNKANKQGWTPLHFALQNGNEEMVDLLLQAGANPAVVTLDTAESVVHVAARHASPKLVREMVKRATGNINGIDRANHTPLHYAETRGDQEVISALLDNGALRTPQDLSQAYPQYIKQKNLAKIQQMVEREKVAPTQPPLLILAVKENADEVIKYLGSKGTDINQKWPADAPNALLYAAQSGNKATIQAILELGADAQEKFIKTVVDNKNPKKPVKTDHKLTAFELLIKNNKLSDEERAFLVPLLVKAGADVNELTGEQQETPWQMAKAAQQFTTLQALADAGASKVESDESEQVKEYLKHAHKKELTADDWAVVKRLVEKEMMDVNAYVNSDNKHTPFMLAYHDENRPLMEYLKASKANIEIPDKRGLTPLNSAALFDDVDTITFLQSLDANMQSTSFKDYNFIQLILRNDKKLSLADKMKMVEKSLKAGVDPNHVPDVKHGAPEVQKGEVHRSALVHALYMEEGWKEMADLLIQHGAKVDLAIPYYSTINAVAGFLPYAKIKYLIEKGANLTNKLFDQTLIYLVATNKKLSSAEKAELITLAGKAGVDANHIPDVSRGAFEFKNPRHLALKGLMDSEKDWQVMAEALIGVGASMDKPGENGTSSVTAYMAQLASADKIRFLIEKGANVKETLYNDYNFLNLIMANEVITPEERVALVTLAIDKGVDLNHVPDTAKNAPEPLKTTGKIPFDYAYEKGWDEVIRLLHAHGGKGNVLKNKDKSGQTPLMIAAQTESAQEIQKLLDYGADLGDMINDYNFINTLLLNYKLTQEERENLTKMAIGKGIDHLHIPRKAKGALEISATEVAPIDYAVKKGWEGLVKIFRTHGAVPEVVNQKARGGQSALAAAAQYSTLAEIKKLLDYGANIKDMINDYSFINLIMINEKLNEDQMVELVGLAIKAGLDINHVPQVKNGAIAQLVGTEKSPLDLAYMNKWSKLAKFLKENGGKIVFYNTPSKNGQTPLANAAQNLSMSDIQTLLGYETDIHTTINNYNFINLVMINSTLNQDDRMTLVKLALEKKVNPNNIPAKVEMNQGLAATGKAPVDLALDNGWEELAVLLQEHGGKIHNLERRKNEKEHTYLTNATRNLPVAEIRSLMEQGADIKATVNGYNLINLMMMNDKLTPTDRVELALVLLQSGLDANHSPTGKRPIDLAIENDWKDLANTLYLLGARSEEINKKGGSSGQSTLLTRAAASDTADRIKFLLDVGGDINVITLDHNFINMVLGNDVITPVERLELVKLGLKKGIDPNHVPNAKKGAPEQIPTTGKSPMDFALEKGMDSIVNALVEHMTVKK